MNFINFNGQIYPGDRNFFGVSNRGINYGDGLFETIRVFDGNMPFLDRHFLRLVDGLNVLEIIIPESFDRHFLQKELNRLVGNQANARVRFTAIRRNGGLYTPIDNRFDFIIETSPLDYNHFMLNKQGLKLGICKNITCSFNALSAIKSCNGLPYILASNYAKKSDFDDCLILNPAGNIAESSNSNIFIKIDNTLYTPPLEDGCLAGVTRRVIMEICEQEKIPLHVKSFQPDSLALADEVFLTNAISGIRWVRQYEDFSYRNIISQKLINAMNKFFVHPI